MNEALVNNEKNTAQLEKLLSNKSIRKYSSVSSLLLSQSLQRERIARWKNYWTAEKNEKLKLSLVKNSAAFKFKENAFADFYSLLQKDYKPLNEKDFSNTIIDYRN